MYKAMPWLALLHHNGLGHRLRLFFLRHAQVKDTIGVCGCDITGIDGIIYTEATGKRMFAIFPARPTFLFVLLVIFFLVLQSYGKHIPAYTDLEVLFFVAWRYYFQLEALTCGADIDRYGRLALKAVEAPKCVIEDAAHVVMEQTAE